MLLVPLVRFLQTPMQHHVYVVILEMHSHLVISSVGGRHTHTWTHTHTRTRALQLYFHQAPHCDTLPVKKINSDYCGAPHSNSLHEPTVPDPVRVTKLWPTPNIFTHKRTKMSSDETGAVDLRGDRWRGRSHEQRIQTRVSSLRKLTSFILTPSVVLLYRVQ